MNRREILKTTTVLWTGTLGGCLFAGSGDGCSLEVPAEGFVISNIDATTHTLSITVIRELIVHTEKVFSANYELGSANRDDSSLVVSDVVEIAGPHILKLELENGASMSYLWEVTTDRCDTLRITIENGKISVSETGDKR